MKTSFKKSSVIHPFLFAAFPIIFLFSYNIDNLFPEEVFLPLFFIILITFLIWIIISFILKNKKKSGLIVSLGLVLFFSYGHVYIFLESGIYDEIWFYLESEFLEDIYDSHELLLFIFLIPFIAGTWYFIKTKRKLDNVTKIVNAIAILMIVINMPNIIIYYSQNNPNFDLNNVNEVMHENISGAKAYPDIYFIILDEYANSSLLKQFLDYDNEEFDSFLIDKGFFIAPESYSNYPRTAVSIPSILNMEYIHLRVDELGVPYLNGKVVSKLTENNKVMQYLKSKGYTIISFNSGMPPTNKMKSADIHLCDDVNNLDSELVPLLFRTSMLNPVHVQILGGDYRDRILCIFSELSKMPERTEKPKFVFAHIMLPHQPYVFGAYGEPVMQEGINKLNWVWDQERYINQLKFANNKMKETIDKMFEEDDEAVILILSDHGMRHGEGMWEAPSKEFLIKRYGSFMAYYFPEQERNLLLENTTNVNSFRILFNSYFNDDFEVLEDKIYASPNGDVFNFTDVTDILLNP